jgi:integrase/recombinase XerD
MKKINIDKTIHRGEAVVVIQFPYDNQLGAVARALKNSCWSRNLKAWYVPYSMEALTEIKKAFDAICTIDATLLRTTLAKEKGNIQHKKELHPETIQKIKQFVNWMRSRRYSENTITTYIGALESFLKFHHTKTIVELTNDDVIVYNTEFILKNKLSASYQSQVVNAIKLFFRTIQHTSFNSELLHRPKKPKLLPNVLSKEEIKAILNAHRNIKHKTMLSLIPKAYM